MPGPDADLALLTEAARAAGVIAMRHYAGDRASWEKEGGQGPLTKADLEIDEMLRTRLLAARPDYGWLSEETPDSPARLDHSHVFVVDPIDGTRSFIEGSKSFAHSLAVVRDGVVTAGVVYLPALDRLYGAALGRGATLNGTTLQVSPATEGPDTTVLTGKPQMQPDKWPGGVPEHTRSYRSSFANRLALVAEGRFDAIISFRDAWEWDIAGGALIVTEAGGIVTDRAGQPLRFNAPRAMQAGILAAGPALHGQLMARLQPPAA